MAGKKDIATLMDLVQDTPGWRVDRTSGKHFKCVNEGSGEFVVVPVTPSDIRTYANVVAQLRRRGWSEELAEMAKADDRAERLAADRERGEARLAAAQDDIEAELRREEARKAEVVTVPLVSFTKPEAPTITPAPEFRVPIPAPLFQTPVTPARVLVVADKVPAIPPGNEEEENDVENDETAEEQAARIAEALKGCRSEFLEISQEQADKWLEKGPCRQRDVSDNEVAKLRKIIERRRFIGNPADHIVLDIHGCVANGQHRLFAWFDTPEEIAQANYPNGLPVYVTYDCPPELVKVFDTGRRRSAKDALDVEKMPQFGKDGVAVMRLIENLDGGKPWQGWNKEIWLNDDFTELAATKYRDLPPYLPLGRAIYKDSGLNRIVAAAMAYMINRDNPDGGPGGTNEEFWLGVRFRIPLEPNDPRAALYKFTQSIKNDKTKTVKTPVLVGHVLRQYANWHLGIKLSTSKHDEDWKIFPVWQDGFRILSGELRAPLRDWKPKTDK